MGKAEDRALERASRADRLAATKATAKKKRARAKGPAKYSRSKGKVAPGRKRTKFPVGKAMSKAQTELKRLHQLREKCQAAMIRFAQSGATGFRVFATFLWEVVMSDVVDKRDWVDWVAGECDRLKDRLVREGLHNE